MTVVDIHCHTFNADDLPVRGFLRMKLEHNAALEAAVARMVQIGLQTLAPSGREAAHLARLLERDDIDEHPGSVAPTDTPSLDVAADWLVEQLAAEDLELAQQAELEASSESPSEPSEAGDVVELVGIHRPFPNLSRHARFAKLFTTSRLELTATLIRTYPQVDLFTPLLVDLHGLGDRPKTAVDEQLGLQYQLSQLSIQGKLDAVVLPFVGFHPATPNAVKIVRRAVHRYGCIGVKMYPPVGFRPFGNAEAPPLGVSPEAAKRMDDALAALYDFCIEEQVPITAHANRSNYADEAFKDFSSPAAWSLVLTDPRWADLHLNLGHFGWDGPGWPGEIASLMGSHDGLFADMGNFREDELADFVQQVQEMAEEPETATVVERLMFGSDWFMSADNPHYEQVLNEILKRYDAAFPQSVDSFQGEAARRFLGFDQARNQNTMRVRQRFEDEERAIPTWLEVDA